MKTQLKTKRFINRSKPELLNWNSANWYKNLLVVLLILLFLTIIILRFFHNGNRWWTSEELNSSIYINYHLYYFFGLMVVGSSIPIVGVAMQVITHNKLAEPTTLGFYPMIYLATLLAQLTVNSNASSYLIAITLSSLVILINFFVVKGNPTRNTFKSVIIGFCINAVVTGINYLVITYTPVSGDPLSWLSGGFGYITKNRLIISGTIAVVFTLVLFCLVPYLNIINKNYVLAKMLGIKVNLIYWIVALCSVVIAISSVLLIGGLILLGIVIPHLVRIIFKPKNILSLFLWSGFMGISLLFGSDWMVSGIQYTSGVTLNINLLPSILSIGVFVYLLKSKNYA